MSFLGDSYFVIPTLQNLPTTTYFFSTSQTTAMSFLGFSFVFKMVVVTQGMRVWMSLNLPLSDQVCFGVTKHEILTT